MGLDSDLSMWHYEFEHLIIGPLLSKTEFTEEEFYPLSTITLNLNISSTKKYNYTVVSPLIKILAIPIELPTCNAMISYIPDFTVAN